MVTMVAAGVVLVTGLTLQRRSTLSAEVMQAGNGEIIISHLSEKDYENGISPQGF
jgi:hypothetical protein